MVFLIVFAAPAAVGVVALAFAVVWLSRPDARGDVARRYPLRTLTWLMAGPGGLAAFAAVYMGIGFQSFGISWGGGDGGLTAFEDLVERYAMPAAGLLGTATAIGVIVIAHRVVSPRRTAWPWLMPILAAVPVLFIVVAVPALGSDLPGAVAGYLLALGALANALMAVPVARNPARASATSPAPSAPSPYLPPTPPPPASK